MAKDDKQKLYNEGIKGSRTAGTQYDQQLGTTNYRGDVTWDRGTEDYAGAFKGYSDYAGGGGLTQADKDRMQGAINAWGSGTFAGGAGGGGVGNPLAGKQSNYRGLSSAYGSAYRPDYGEADTGFRKLSGASGGFDQGQLDQIYGNVGRLSEIGRTGGITDEDKANILRQSILDQEKTGGYTDQDKALIRAKSAASSPAYFGALKDNLERQRSATGNLANAGAVDFKLARQAAQQQGQDRTGSEIGLQESIRGGRERAGQFLSGQGMELAGLRTANELAGARSAGDLGLSTQQGITSNQLQGLQGLAGSQTNLGQWGLGQAGGLDQFGLAQAGGLDQWDISNAAMEQQAQASNSARSSASADQAARANAEYQQWLTEYGNQQKQYGIGGLENLYNTNLGASMDYSRMGIDTLSNKYNSQAQMLGLATQNRGATGMENMGTIANAAGGVIGAFTGTGALKGLLGGGVGAPNSGIAPTQSGGIVNTGQLNSGYTFGRPQVPTTSLRQPTYNYFG